MISLTEKQPAVRDTHMEWLRIVAMVMIVFSHYAVHGSFDSGTLPPVSRAVLNVMGGFGKLGVNIFVLISGYFLYTKPFSLKRIVKFCLQVIFYAVLMYGISVACGFISFDISDLLSVIFVFISGDVYWFALSYFTLMLVSPLLNAGLRALRPRTHLLLILTFFVLWCLLPFCSDVLQVGMDSLGFSVLLWFIWLYTTGSYIHRTDGKTVCRKHRGTLFILTAASLLLYCTALFVFPFLPEASELSGIYTLLYRLCMALSDTLQNDLMPCIVALLLFMLFVCIEVPNSRRVNTVSKATFGVYLLHDNAFFAQFLWRDVLKTTAHTQPVHLIIHGTLCVLAVFSLGTAVELLRMRYPEAWLFRKTPFGAWCDTLENRLKGLPSKDD